MGFKCSLQKKLFYFDRLENRLSIAYNVMTTKCVIFHRTTWNKVTKQTTHKPFASKLWLYPLTLFSYTR